MRAFRTARQEAAASVRAPINPLWIMLSISVRAVADAWNIAIISLCPSLRALSLGPYIAPTVPGRQLSVKVHRDQWAPPNMPIQRRSLFIYLGGMCSPLVSTTGAARAAGRGPIRDWRWLHIGEATLPGACQLGMADVANSPPTLRSCASHPQHRLPAPVSAHEILFRLEFKQNG